jgi:hypothetical protein
MVRGAIIDQIEGSTIIAHAQWGSTKLTLHIVETGSTRLQPQMASKDMSLFFKVGHVIGLTGSLDMTASEPVIYAAALRDESLVQSDATMTGSVLNTTGSSFVIETSTGTSSVATGTGTIMTMGGNPVNVSRLQPGDTVIAIGTFDTVHASLAAERVTVMPGQPGIPNTGISIAPRKQSGIFEGIWKWLML